MSEDPSEREINERANEKARKRKAARNKILATKTVEKGLLIVHTGKGKGKSTAAFGLAVRALGNGMRVGVVQYVKGDRARDIAAAEAAWQASKEMIEACRGDNPKYDMVVLDELNIVLRYDYLPLNEVIEVLKNRPENLHIIVTGRNAKDELIEIADLVTEMTQVKHPFREQNVKAQKGIEF
jgi:cob(I)alamin adenosyltransferase